MQLAICRFTITITKFLLLDFQRNRNLRISKALLKSQAHQGTSLFTSPATNQRGFSKGGQEKFRSAFQSIRFLPEYQVFTRFFNGIKNLIKLLFNSVNLWIDPVRMRTRHVELAYYIKFAEKMLIVIP